MSQPKVFEYAKELGMETLTLMDKIREWKLPVKSHMAALDEAMMDQIQVLLKEEAEKKAPKKKKVVRKKTASTAKKKTAKKATATKKKTTVKRATTVKKATATKKAAGTTKKTTTKKKTAAGKVAPVIRRKAAHSPEAIEKAAAEEAARQEALAAEAAAATAAETQAAAAAVAEPEGTTTETADAATPEEAAAAAPAAEAKRKTRGNIVGKMDLTRLKPPGGAQRGSGGGAQSGSRGGPAGGATRNLRTGFVAPSPMTEPVVADDSFDKKKDKTPAKKKAGAGGKEVPQASFVATDFRKREVIFQPKKKKPGIVREGKKTQLTTPKASKRIVKVHETISVSDLAQQMGVKAPQVVKKLIAEGVMARMNTDLDFDTVSLIAPEFGFEAQNVHQSAEKVIETVAFGDLEADKITRPPVVTVMGHVDHGKTTLLDAIRSADVASGEKGGITQHIGAYSVSLGGNKVVTFIDTPGHAAFTAMRARGANVTDIVIIVVAADDGVMPQTQEAISHAKAAKVPIIVAVNKMDRPDANADKIRQQLTEYELVPEDWGGDTIFCNVSALKNEGIKELLEQIHLVAEVQELKANPKQSGTGIVIESSMEKGRGSVATLLIQDGTVKVGQSICAGKVAGRIRGMSNDRGERVKEAGPGDPIEVIGLPEAPGAGSRFDICKDESTAQDLAELRRAEEEQANTSNKKLTLEEIFSKVKDGGVQELSVVLKSDVDGSIEAIKGMFEKLDTDEVKVKIIHSAVGGISESDILLAGTAGGLVLGFNVRPDNAATRLAKEKGVEIKTYGIIYQLVDDIKLAMSGLLSPDIIEKSQGSAEVRETFSVPKIGTIAGCSVTDGKITRNSLARLVRDGRVIYEGKLSSLKRFKDDAKEVASGYECGIGIENYNDLKVGDVIEAYIKEEVARELE